MIVQANKRLYVLACSRASYKVFLTTTGLNKEECKLLKTNEAVHAIKAGSIVIFLSGNYDNVDNRPLAKLIRFRKDIIKLRDF